ncbi:MAG: hypothetical protein IJ447_01710 [Clostridia bacterium]|nr:hypothetical protein [Clostridia bacterium]
MNKNKDLLYKVPLFAVLTAVLIAVPLRVYQYFKLINPETGFYDNKDFSIVVVYAVLAVAMFACIAFSYIKHKSIKVVTIGKDSKIFIGVSMLMALGVAVDSFGMFSDYLSLYSEGTNGYINMSDYISAQGGSIMLIQAIFGIISAIYFAVAGISSLNKTNAPKLKLLAVFPVAWCIFRLLIRFKRTISFVNVSDLLLEMFMIVFVMMFLLALAQVNSKIDEKTVFWKLFAYGCPAVMFSLVCFLPRFILIITGNSDLVNPTYLPNFSDFTFAVYATYICISAAKAKITVTE